MKIKRIGFVYLVSLLPLLAISGPIEAQRVPVCGWCEYYLHIPGPTLRIASMDNGPEGHVSLDHSHEDQWWHRFPTSAADACVGNEDAWNQTCAACGGTSMCHRFWMRGFCHAPCSWPGPPRFVGRTTLEEIQEALEGNDIEVLASTVSRERTGVFVEFIPESGRIDLLLPCDPNRAAYTIPVEPEVREQLKAALAARPG